MSRRALLPCLAVALIAHGAAACWLARPAAHVHAHALAAARARRVVAIELVAPPAAPARAAPGPSPEPATPPTTRAAPAPEALAAATAPHYAAPAELDVVARPRSAPDISTLQGLSWSGVPMRLRLFVDAGGTIVDVAVLQSQDEPQVVERVRRMFLATAFTPGRVGGVDVASYRDIELNIADRAG